MQALVTAVVVGAALLLVAIWIEVRERSGAPEDSV